MIDVLGEVSLKRGKEYSIQRFHPWVFSGAIHSAGNHLTDGSWVSIADHHGNVLGYGHYQRGSIAIRVLSFGTERPHKDFWSKKLQAAIALRRHIGLPSASTDAYRLVHGEGDGLPGLIIDYYNGVAVMQAHSAGMHYSRYEISQALQDTMVGLKAVYYKSHGTLPGDMREDEKDEYLFGTATVPHLINENNNKFLVDWEDGQKTGFFLDQRENRAMLGRLSEGKKVLNTFCYTGGFSVYALQQKATLVHSLDASARAIELTKENIARNGFDPELHACFIGNTFEFLSDKQDVYDVVVLDPPAFAKHREARHQAVKGYQRLNAAAMRVIRSGGILFTFSCSQVVDRKLFYDTIVSSAIQAGREIKVLQHLNQPADHPVSIFHPEGEYLKGLVLSVV